MIVLTGRKILNNINMRWLTSFSKLYPEATVDKSEGDHPYGSRQYVLRQQSGKSSMVLAKIHAHRNIVFGAKTTTSDDFIEVCSPLLREALIDCSADGEQPQAVAALHGLCAWVRQEIEKNKLSAELSEIEKAAVQAIATGIPREGHSVVGQGTHRDAATAWSDLAKQYATQSAECQLYQRFGGQLVKIELLADTSPDYLQSAGGAMARFFFI